MIAGYGNCSAGRRPARANARGVRRVLPRWPAGGYGRRLTVVAFEEVEGVSVAELRGDILAEALFEQVLENGHFVCTVEQVWDIRAVKVSAECDGVLSAKVEPVLYVGGDLIERDGLACLSLCTLNEEIAAVVEADDATAGANLGELGVCEVARMVADGTGV